jgi:hypothetical protein
MELSCESNQVLGFDNVLNRITKQRFFTERVTRGEIRLAVLKTRVDNDLARQDICRLSVLFGVIRGPEIARIIMRVDTRSD